MTNTSLSIFTFLVMLLLCFSCSDPNSIEATMDKAIDLSCESFRLEKEMQEEIQKNPKSTAQIKEKYDQKMTKLRDEMEKLATQLQEKYKTLSKEKEAYYIQKAKEAVAKCISE